MLGLGKDPHGGAALFSGASVSQTLAQNCLLPMYLTPQWKAVNVHGIHHLPWDLGMHTTSCTTPSTAKGEKPPQRTFLSKTQSQRANLMLLVAHPCHAVPSQTPEQQFPASRKGRQTLQSWHTAEATQTQVCSRTKPQKQQGMAVISQIHSHSCHSFSFLRAQSCTESCQQPQSLSPSQECSPSSSPVSYHSSGQLSSAPRRKIIPAAHAHELCPQWYTCPSEKPQKGEEENPWGMVGQKWTGKHSHSYPALKWSYIHVGFQEKGCYGIFHCTSSSAVRCAMFAQSAPNFCILVLFLMELWNEKAIKLTSYKIQIYLLYWAKSIDLATPLIPTEVL